MASIAQLLHHGQYISSRYNFKIPDKINDYKRSMLQRIFSINKICQSFNLSFQNALYLSEPDVHSAKSLATLQGEIVDPEITVKFGTRDALKVHGAQT